MKITYVELLALGRSGKVSPNGIYYTERGIYIGVNRTSIRLYLSNDNPDVTGTNTGDQLTFNTVAVSGQFDVLATSITDTLTLVAGTNVTLTTNAAARSVTINASGGGSGISDGDYGDVTVSGSGTVLTVDNNTISLAKMADVATSTVFYRKTAGTGDPEVQTLATLKTDLGLTGTNSGDQTSVTGNAGTATALQTARNIQGVSFNGTANIDIISGTGFVKVSGTTLSYDNSTYLTTASAASTYAPIASPTFTGTVSGITKAMVGLSNVVNLDTSTTANITDSTNKRFVTDAQQTVLTNTSNTNTGDQLTFKTVAVATQPNIVAESATETLTFKAGTNITLVTDNTTKELTISSSGGGLSDADYGDITVSGTGTTMTIDNGVVTLAKMANMATSSLIYRKTAGSGAPEVNTLATLKTDLGLTGTNSGDQTSIVGITGTLAQFNTACTDADFAPLASPGFSGTVIMPTGGTGAAGLNFPSGTLATTPNPGDVEFDGVNFYSTNDTTSRRGAIVSEQHFKLTSTGTPVGPGIGDYFGANSSISLVNGAYYEIEFELYFLKNTAGTLTWTLTNTAAPTSQNIYYEMSPITGIVAPPGGTGNLSGNYYNDATAARAFGATGSLSNGANHYVYISVQLRNNTGANLRLRVTNSAGTVTPGIGSRWRCRRIPSGNTGTFAA